MFSSVFGRCSLTAHPLTRKEQNTRRLPSHRKAATNAATKVGIMLKLGAMFTATYVVLASTCMATKSLSFQVHVPALSCSRNRFGAHHVPNDMRTVRVPKCHRTRLFQFQLDDDARESISKSKPLPKADVNVSQNTPMEDSSEYYMSLRGGGSEGSSELTNNHNLSSLFSIKSLALYTLLLVELGTRITDNVNMALSTQLLSTTFWSSIAPFASIALKMSPLPTILTVRKKKTVGGLPLLPYNAMATLTFVLVAYGKSNNEFFTINFFQKFLPYMIIFSLSHTQLCFLYT